ncbi:MAG: AlpA family phage regulatory protein [Novosphingobium sp.]
MAEGRFPKGRSLGPRCAVWVESEIDAWIEAIASTRPLA